MKKILFALLFAMPAAVFAANSAERIGFTDIDLTKLPSIEVPAAAAPVFAAEAMLPETKPPLKPVRAEDYYFNSYILKAVEYIKKNYAKDGGRWCNV